jgi:hypothetical protein
MTRDYSSLSFSSPGASSRRKLNVGRAGETLESCVEAAE